MFDSAGSGFSPHATGAWVLLVIVVVLIASKWWIGRPRSGGPTADRHPDRTGITTGSADLAVLVEAMPGRVVVTDRRGRVVIANAAFCHGCARSPGAVAGVPVDDLVPGEPGRYLALDASESPDQPIECVIPASPPDHEPGGRAFAIMTRSVALADGATARLSAICEVSCRREASPAPRIDEARLRTILDHIPAFVLYAYRVDDDWRVEFANAAYLKSIGKREHEVAGRSARDFLDPNAYERVAAMIERVSRGEHVRYERMQRIEATGEENHLLVQMIPDCDSRGAVVGHYLFGVDVTEQRRAEARARESARKFRSLTELSSDFYWEQDEELRFVRTEVDDAQVGRNVSAGHLGKRPWEIERFTPLSMDWTRYRELTDAREEYRDFVIASPAGHDMPRYLSISGQPVHDADGRYRGYRGVGRDVTAQRNAEDAIRAAKVAAEEANRVKSEFLATMSHELRTPMNGVLGMTELLLATVLDEKQRRYAALIERSGTGLLAIINDILDFSRIEAGRMSIDAVDFDLVELVDDVTALLQAQIAAKSLAFACVFDPGMPARVRGDPARVRQILSNLVGNAVKFTDRGEVTVAIELLPAPESAPDDGVSPDAPLFVRFRVRDTGIGMSPETIARLFNAFTQADGSMSRRFGGTGLGLAICRQLVGLMGGTIGVTSEPGAGSEFWCTVPFSHASTAAADAEAAAHQERCLLT